jgi:DNA-binding LacI/PurR family transcriptional regulator
LPIFWFFLDYLASYVIISLSDEKYSIAIQIFGLTDGTGDMEIRLKDIAVQCGVSISTVSRILSHDTSRKIKESTVEKVIDTARKMGYFEQRAFLAAQKESYTIGCIFTSDHESFLSPFFSRLLAGIQKELSDRKDRYDITFYTFNISEPRYRIAIAQSHLDGAIVLGRTTLENISYIKEHIPFLVYAGLNRIEQDFDEVLCDARKGFAATVGYLHGLGHRKIGFIGPTQQKHPVFNEHRYEGFCDGLAAAGLELDEDYVYDSFLTATDGYEGMKTLARQDTIPTAIVCGNDTVATGVLKALEEEQVKVPGQVSVIGFDNIENAAFLKPSLTTVDVPKKELGRYATMVLLEKIGNKRAFPIEVSLPFSIVERESTGTAPDPKEEER